MYNLDLLFDLIISSKSLSLPYFLMKLSPYIVLPVNGISLTTVGSYGALTCPAGANFQSIKLLLYEEVA